MTPASDFQIFFQILIFRILVSVWRGGQVPRPPHFGRFFQVSKTDEENCWILLGNSRGPQNPEEENEKILKQLFYQIWLAISVTIESFSLNFWVGVKRGTQKACCFSWHWVAMPGGQLFLKSCTCVLWVRPKKSRSGGPSLHTKNEDSHEF